MSRCMVVCAAPVTKAALLHCAGFSPDLTIAADGGYLRCAELGLHPDVILGDFDSAPVPQNCDALVYSSHKDDTDCMLALRAGVARGCRDFVLLGCTGGRLDHTLAAVQSLGWLAEQGAQGMIVDDTHTLRLVEGGQSLRLPQFAGYLSVFALDTCCMGVTLQGVEYPLHSHTLTNSFPLGVSNHITEAWATITCAHGRLLVVTAC